MTTSYHEALNSTGGVAGAESAVDGPPLVLALETSTPVLSVALLHRTHQSVTLLSSRTVAPPAVVSTLVPGLFDELLREAGAGRDDVGCAVAGLGPGLFTGARVAVATMKAVAYARAIPLLGAGSLEALALAAGRGGPLQPGDRLSLDAPLTTGWLCPVIDARKGEVYLAVQRWKDGRFEQAVPPRAATPSVAHELLNQPPHPQAVGAGLTALGLAPPAGATGQPPAAETAFLALRHDRAARFDPARVLAVEPAYLRPPEAEVARQRRLAGVG